MLEFVQRSVCVCLRMFPGGGKLQLPIPERGETDFCARETERGPKRAASFVRAGSGSLMPCGNGQRQAGSVVRRPCNSFRQPPEPPRRSQSWNCGALAGGGLPEAARESRLGGTPTAAVLVTASACFVRCFRCNAALSCADAGLPDKV